MKRLFILLAFSLCLAGRCASGQDAAPAPADPASTNAVTNTSPAPTAASIAAQQDAEERYKRMAADIQALQLDNESLKAKIALLERRIEELRQLQAADNNNNKTGVQEDLKRLDEKIVSVDKKRLEDSQAISEQIRSAIAELKKTLAGAPAPGHSSSNKVQLEAPTPNVENGVSYTIKEHDNLTAIVKAYNVDFKSNGWKPITVKLAEDANPNVDWNRLVVGQKIVIPLPAGADAASMAVKNKN